MYRRPATDQGSTFLWTEGYGDDARRVARLELLRDLALGAAMMLLAAGAASFLGSAI